MAGRSSPVAISLRRDRRSQGPSPPYANRRPRIKNHIPLTTSRRAIRRGSISPPGGPAAADISSY